MMELNIVFVKINHCSIFFMILWPNRQAGKMKKIVFSDWLPHFPLGISCIGPARKRVLFMAFWLYNRSFIDQACSVNIAVYCPRSFWLFY